MPNKKNIGTKTLETKEQTRNLEGAIPDLLSLYEGMLKSRLFEKAVTDLWNEGKILGEMHLSMGEEAIVAGIVRHVTEGDAMALDHRGTAAMVMRGVDLTLLFKEFLGRLDGLCKGWGGHMHLFSKAHLAASSGIVGAAGPVASGFALASKHLRPGKVAVAFFGEGAMNQGMLLESFNLAVAWQLPVIFVCKDNAWAITTPSPSVTGGNLLDRAASFGMPVVQADGLDVEKVWNAALGAFERARSGKGPSFLIASCTHLEGHFLGDPLLRVQKHPIQETRKMAGPLLSAITRPKGAPLKERASSLRSILSLVGKSLKEHSFLQEDPLKRAERKLDDRSEELRSVDSRVRQEIQKALEKALA